MAGGGEAEDNPVNMNVVAMVDIIFCLCVFFMCSFKFKQLEGNFKSWLPKNKGNATAVTETPIEIRIAMFWEEPQNKVRRMYGHRVVENDAELENLIRSAHADAVASGKPDTPVIIDGHAKVPWEEVVTVVNIIKRLQIDKMEFAMGAALK